MHPTMHTTTYLLLSRDRSRERRLEAERHSRVVRLQRLLRQERRAERASTRPRRSRLAVG